MMRRLRTLSPNTFSIGTFATCEPWQIVDYPSTDYKFHSRLCKREKAVPHLIPLLSFSSRRPPFVFRRCGRVKGDILEVGVGQLAVDAIDEGAEFAGIDEEGLLAAVVEAPLRVGVLVFREEPEADGDLRAVEELAGEGDHAVHKVGLDEGTVPQNVIVVPAEPVGFRFRVLRFGHRVWIFQSKAAVSSGDKRKSL